MPTADLLGSYNSETGTYNLEGQKPAVIRFETVAEPVMQPGAVGELPVPKLDKNGVAMTEDVDYVTVSQPGDMNSVKFEADRWITRHVPMELQSGRLHPEVARYYKRAYEHWKEKKELPLEGTSVKNWPAITPAQVKLLLDMNIRTVEELASLADDGVRRLGMGGVDLKQRAKSWLSAGQDRGKITAEMTELKQTNELLQKNLAAMQKQLDAMTKDKKGSNVTT